MFSNRPEDQTGLLQSGIPEARSKDLLVALVHITAGANREISSHAMHSLAGFRGSVPYTELEDSCTLHLAVVGLKILAHPKACLQQSA